MLSQQDTLHRLKMIRHSSRADRIRRRSLTISDLARATGVPREYLHRIASDKAPLAPKAHAKLSGYFECEENCGERSHGR